MQLSTRGRYAVMAMVELAGRGETAAGPVTLAQIAACQQLSQCYLEQLFGCLRRAGLVLSTRGPGGGYRLARPAEELTIGMIVDAVDENLRATRCGQHEAGCLRDEEGMPVVCGTHDLWAELGRQVHVFLHAITLSDVTGRRVRGRAVRPAPAPATAEQA